MQPNNRKSHVGCEITGGKTPRNKSQGLRIDRRLSTRRTLVVGEFGSTLRRHPGSSPPAGHPEEGFPASFSVSLRQ